MNSTISFGSVSAAGLMYAFNPASFLGVTVFLFFLLRVKSEYGRGVFFPGIIFLIAFFPLQFLVHIGIFDFFPVYIPGFSALLDITRVCVAAAVLVLGFKIFLACLAQDSCDLRGVLRPIIGRGLNKGKAVAQGAYQICLIVIKSFFWAAALAFFCGMWPLHGFIIDLIYQHKFGMENHFFLKMAVFELVVIVPFLAVLFLTNRFFYGGGRLKQAFYARLGTLGFSAWCLIGGISTLAYYFMEYI